jgi:hypothetical protein
MQGFFVLSCKAGVNNRLAEKFLKFLEIPKSLKLKFFVLALGGPTEQNSSKNLLL